MSEPILFGEEEPEDPNAFKSMYEKELESLDKQQLEQCINKLQSTVDNLSNSQQMDMLRLQSMSNKREEAFDVMQSFIKKMQDSRSEIIRNMR